MNQNSEQKANEKRHGDDDQWRINPNSQEKINEEVARRVAKIEEMISKAKAVIESRTYKMPVKSEAANGPERCEDERIELDPPLPGYRRAWNDEYIRTDILYWQSFKGEPGRWKERDKQFIGTRFDPCGVYIVPMEPASSLTTTHKVRQTIDKFWMVLGNAVPTFRHQTLLSATTEAERLARLQPGYYFTVLESVATVKVSELQWQKHNQPSDKPEEGVPF